MKILALLLCLFASPAFAVDPRPDPGPLPPPEKPIEIFMQQQISKDFNVRFYMWVFHKDVDIDNNGDNVYTGFDFGGGGGAYIASEEIRNIMFFVHPATKETLSNKVRIVIGGIRTNDIHIYMPKGYKASINVNTIDKSLKE